MFRYTGDFLFPVELTAIMNHYIPCRQVSSAGSEGGRGSTLLSELYRYVRPQRIWFFSCYGRRVSIMAILVINRVWCLHSSLEMGMSFYKKLLFSSLSIRPSTKALHNAVNIAPN